MLSLSRYSISPRRAITFCIPASLMRPIISRTVCFVGETHVKCASVGTPYRALIFFAISKVYWLVSPPSVM